MSERPPSPLVERPRWSLAQRMMVAGVVTGILGVVTILSLSLLEVRTLETELRSSDDAAEQFLAVMREAGRLEADALRAGTLSTPEVVTQTAVLARHVTVLGRLEHEPGGMANAEKHARLEELLGLHAAFERAIDGGSDDVPAATALLAGVERSAKAAADIAETERRGRLLDQIAATHAVTLGTLGATVLVLLINVGLLASVRRRSQRAYAEAYDLALARARDLETSNDRLRAANETKRRFISMVSHELRTPLTVIRGFAETLARHGDALEPAQRAQLTSSIVGQALRQERMVEDLLVVARHSDRPPEPEPMALHVDLLIQRVEELLGGVGPTIDVLPGPACAVWADPHQAEQVLENLLTNAGKYGGPTIEVSWAHDAGTVVLVVEDDGPGVPAAFVDSLFEPFTQADEGDTRMARGVGLGLTIAQLLVASNGGSLAYRDRDPHGARFEIRLPRASLDATHEVAGDARGDGTSTPGAVSSATSATAGA